LRVFYKGETCLYSSAEEATKDMERKGLPVPLFKLPMAMAEKIKAQMWNTQRAPKPTGQLEKTWWQGYKE